jgi:hypothetical protein
MGATGQNIIKRSAYRLGPRKCTVNKYFESNNRFKCVKGKEWWIDGEPVFTSVAIVRKKDGSYRTRFGFGCEHSAIVYCKCDHCFALALRRLTCKRKPEKQGIDILLKVNQIRNFSKPKLFLMMQDLYRSSFSEYTCFMTEAEWHHADPHVKKALRVQGYEEVLTLGVMGTTWVKVIVLSFKKEEYAKPHNKYPRVYANLGIHSSLRGFILMERMKTAMSKHPIFINGGEIAFIKTPSRTNLKHVFDNLIEPKGKFYAPVFSDDSCLSVNQGNRTITYNLDISSCDSSHFDIVFDSFEKIFPDSLQDEIKVLTAQCASLCKLYSENGIESISLVPQGKFLPSGSVLTTALNTFVVFMLIIQITLLDIITPETIHRAATRLGYILTVEECITYHDIMFLKHFPARDVSGHIQPVLGLGVIARMSGTCKGDLPGRGPLQPRARSFQKSLLQGAVPYTHYTIIDRMKAKVADADDINLSLADLNLFYKVNFDDDDKIHIKIQDSEIYQRYHLTPYHVQQMMDFANCGFEEFVSNDALGLILDKDYSLTNATSYVTEDTYVRY